MKSFPTTAVALQSDPSVSYGLIAGFLIAFVAYWQSLAFQQGPTSDDRARLPLNFTVRSHGVAATLDLVSALSGQRRLEALQDLRGCLLIAVAVAMATANAAVMAANFEAVRYDNL